MKKKPALPRNKAEETFLSMLEAFGCKIVTVEIEDVPVKRTRKKGR